MITKLRILVASLAVLGLSAAAFAHGGKGPKKHAALVAKFDANKDGTLDDAEKAKLALARKAMRGHKRAGMLAKFDANKDGTLDDAEKSAMRAQRVEKRFAKLDANKDGAITLDEMKAAKPRGKHRRHE